MTLIELKAEIVTRRIRGLDSPNLVRLADDLVAHHAKETKLRRILDDDRLMEDDGTMERLRRDLG